MAYLITKWFGAFMVNENGAVSRHILFPKNPMEIAKRLKAVDEANVLSEETEITAGTANFFVNEERQRKLAGAGFSQKDHEHDAAASITAEQYGFSDGLLREAMLELSKLKTAATSSAADKHIIQAINAIDDLSESANLLYERLQEWYGLHFPELYEVVTPEEFAKLVAEHGDADTILSKANVKAKNRMGGALSERDKKAVTLLAKTLHDTYQAKERLDKYIASSMEDFAPNLSYVAGSAIGARLLSHTGGLERLARVPSSTIQLLGAEKALFRFLKEGGRPPKHGVIFQHPIIHAAPYWQRGKIARALAAKIAMAARVDANSDRFIGEELEADLNKRIEDIRKKFPLAPEKKTETRDIRQPPRREMRFGGKKPGKFNKHHNRKHR